MKQPLVSIIIRTCQRPDMLEQALESIRNQIYTNIEVIVVEDGENKSEELLKSCFPDLNYVYRSTGGKVGRCRAGNLALQLAGGEYINFLDDDDYFLQDHLSCLVDTLQEGDEKAAYSIAEEHQIIVQSRNPYKYKVRKKTIRFKQPFNRILLYTFNYIPIQSILFHRSLYDTFGGLDEQLDTLEDWDLWVRYSTQTRYKFVDKITSCYHTPYQRKVKQKRSLELKDYMIPLHEKFKTYLATVPVEEINQDMIYVMREYKSKGIMRYIRMFFRVVILGER